MKPALWVVVAGMALGAGGAGGVDGTAQNPRWRTIAKTPLGPQPDSPLVRNEHPRVWLTRSNLPRLRDRIKPGRGLHDTAVWLAKLLDANLDNPWLNPLQMYEEYAFAYQLLKDGPIPGVPFRRTASEYGQFAKASALKLVTPPTWAEGGADARVPMMLDWLWDLFTPAERAAYATWIKAGDARIDHGPFQSQVVDARAVSVVGGLVLKGSGIDEAWADAAIAGYLTKFRPSERGVSRAESDLGGGVDAGCAQTLSYCDDSFRYALFAEEAYRTAMGLTEAQHYLSPDANFFRLMPHLWLAHLMPNLDPDTRTRGGQPFAPWVMEPGHYGLRAGLMGPFYHGGMLFSSLAGIYAGIDDEAAGLAQYVITNVTGPPALAESALLLRDGNLIFDVLIRGAENPVPIKKPEDVLGLHIVSPERGRVLWKTSWNPAEESQLVIDAPRWVGGVAAVRIASFEAVYRGAPMVMEQGPAGASGHTQGLCNGSTSGNHLIFPFPRDESCGGLRGAGNRDGSSVWEPGSVYDLRDALDVVDTPAYGYAYVDVTRSYGNTRSPEPQGGIKKVSEVVRQFVLLKPTASTPQMFIVILDRATTVASGGHEKRWLLHPSTPPRVEADGTISWVNTTFGANAAGYLTPVLPAARQSPIFLMDNHSAYGDQTLPIPFSYPFEEPWVGRPTIDLRPESPSPSEIFLNVIELTTPDRAKTPVSYLGNHRVQIGNRVVTFAEKTVSVK